MNARQLANEFTYHYLSYDNMTSCMHRVPMAVSLDNVEYHDYVLILP